MAVKKYTKKNGQALILAYMTIVFLTILSVSLFDKIMSERGMLERQRLEEEAFYLAEGGIEEAINQFISSIANFQIQPRDDASGTQEPGIRLINGSQIYRSSGLTVVSNDPIYIQGDYNTMTR